MIKSILYLFLMLIYSSINAQRLEKIEATLDKDDIILSFNLLPKESNRELYSLVITSSKDNYTTPVIVDKPTKEVKPTNRLSYVISGSKNFEGYNGKVDFKIKATLVYTPLKIVTPEGKITVKKGKPLNVKWKGGNKDDKYKVDLYKSDTKLFTLKSSIDNTSTTWTVPEDTQPGKDYKVKITSKKNPNQAVFTHDFIIKGKTSIIIKLLPVAALGGLAAVLLGGKKSEGGGSTANDDVENPPGPPD